MNIRLRLLMQLTINVEKVRFPVANGQRNVSPTLLRNWRKPGLLSRLLDGFVRYVQNRLFRLKRYTAESIKVFWSREILPSYVTKANAEVLAKPVVDLTWVSPFSSALKK
ncbi:hypothetical protein AV540_15450 [Brevibacillus parabrevis]|nr:hypothetical protein AV540_15450 [Brevibacillus parabrevis]